MELSEKGRTLAAFAALAVCREMADVGYSMSDKQDKAIKRLVAWAEPRVDTMEDGDTVDVMLELAAELMQESGDGEQAE